MGSGGGGSSGQVRYPPYVEIDQQLWLGDMQLLVPAGIAANPYTGVTAYDAESEGNIAAMDTAISNFDTFLDTLDETWITNQIAAQYAILSDRWTNVFQPKFRAGMRDINAVMTSAFYYGQSVALASLMAESQQVGVELRGKIVQLKTEGKRFVSSTTADVERIKVIIGAEFEGRQTELDGMEAKWPFEIYMYAGNLLGAAGGGHAIPNAPSKVMTALGGALSGAAAGSAAGPYGAIAGGVIGGIMGMIA